MLLVRVDDRNRGVLRARLRLLRALGRRYLHRADRLRNGFRRLAHDLLVVQSQPEIEAHDPRLRVLDARRRDLLCVHAPFLPPVVAREELALPGLGEALEAGFREPIPDAEQQQQDRTLPRLREVQLVAALRGGLNEIVEPVVHPVGRKRRPRIDLHPLRQRERWRRRFLLPQLLHQLLAVAHPLRLHAVVAPRVGHVRQLDEIDALARRQVAE
mmetsp:Transcript_7746/g.18728  ORF Transcript_7746/g.18728 Transcript_7746/m.18728 type:complete len:214 (+) Transcript_7746:3229-3870(+)